MQIPKINTEKLRVSIKEMVDIVPTRSMYEIMLRSVDVAMDDLVAAREEIVSEDPKVEAWDRKFEEFGIREAFYYKAFLEEEDNITEAPLFEGKYEGLGFSSSPSWPDIETPWRLANDLATIAVKAGKKQDYLDALEANYKKQIASFWDEANKLLSAERDKYEAEAIDEEVQPGRRFGAWPIIIGAAAAFGLFSAAAGYTAAKKDVPGDFIEKGSMEAYKEQAKNVGAGIAIGIGLMLLFARRR